MTRSPGTDEPVVVLGGGPAGVATAVGLVRLGEPVILVSEPRRIVAIEGASVRVIEAFRGLGLTDAVACFAPASSRRVSWNGEASDANSEALVERQSLDRALLDDAARLGVAVVRGRVIAVTSTASGHQIRVESRGANRTLAARILVEARGRSAPASGQPRIRGVGTVTLSRRWQGPIGLTGSAVQSLADGWAWMAALADGRRHLQIALDVGDAGLPTKKDLARYCDDRFRAIEAARPFLHDAVPVGEAQARSSTPVLDEALVGDNWIRVGDAAMAVDPLSGNGMFQALSSSLQAPAVIRTLRRSPEQAPLAQAFHRQRITHLFQRFARIGRDFHASEQQWPEARFWQTRRAWPDAEPLHRPVTPADVDVARRPVVDRGQIVAADVVVTPDQPLGVWHLGGVSLAAALLAVRGHPRLGARQALIKRLDLPPARAAAVARWMAGQGWIADRGEGGA